MHEWGDDWFKQYGEELNEAIHEIERGLRDCGILVLGKEKWGCYVMEMIKDEDKLSEKNIEDFNKVFQVVCSKHPDIIDELVSDNYWYSYIKPCEFGNVDGTEIHNKYWKSF